MTDRGDEGAAVCPAAGAFPAARPAAAGHRLSSEVSGIARAAGRGRGEEEAGKIAQEYRQASAQQEQEYAETAAALAEKQELSAGEAAEVSRLWRKLVKLFHPDRFAHEPEKQETYHKLTAAINHAKDHGDLATLRASRKTRTASSCGKAGRRSTSARSARSRNCAALWTRSSWKSSACWRRAMRSRRVPITNCTG